MTGSIFVFTHAQLKLHSQFVALKDMKLRAQNQFYASISFWDINVLRFFEILRQEDKLHQTHQDKSLFQKENSKLQKKRKIKS